MVSNAQPLEGENETKVVYVEKNKNGKANNKTISEIVNNIESSGKKQVFCFSLLQWMKILRQINSMLILVNI